MSRQVEYRLYDPHPDHSEQGIFESHMDCVRQGFESGAANMVIFEDDVLFHNFDTTHFDKALQFLARHPHWEVFFLGCLVTQSRPTSSSAVRQVKYRSLAHAYALNRPFAGKLTKVRWSGVPFDAVLRNLQPWPFAIYPSIAFQGNASTDNRRLQRLDKFRRLCGGLKFIQMMNERYHRHFRTIVLAHVAAGLAAAGWLLL